MPQWMVNKDSRVYAASAMFIILILCLMMFLTFVPIPSGSKDLVVSIISMLVGGLGMAMGKLFGESNSETDKLREQNDALQTRLNDLDTKFTLIKEEYDQLIKLIVNRTDLEIKP